jgi:hypothetical protein
MVALLAGCGDDEGTNTSGNPPPTEPTLAELYQAAIEDAKDAEPSEIVDTLTAIDTTSLDLIRDMNGRVLMVTWTSYDGYDAIVGQETTLGVDVWVTPGREGQAFCRETGLSGAALATRLQQVLGLPPTDDSDRMVELWVPEDAMFRPSPDPEITDTVSALDYPAGTPQAHIDWIEALKAESYGADGYPWTRLGYTYDWSPDAASEVGLSEYVIKQGAAVVVESVTPQDTYCQK